MKYLVSILALTMISERAFTLGDTSMVPTNPGLITETAEKINQVSPEYDGLGEGAETQEKIDPVERQERDYQQQQRRERQQWEESRSDYKNEI